MGNGKRYTDEEETKSGNAKIILLFVIITSVLLTTAMMRNSGKDNKVKNVQTEENTKIAMTLNGDDTVYVYKNDEYKDLGVTAVNENNEDESKNIEIKSNVDTSKSGEYSVQYVDKTNKDNVLERKVIVRKSALLKDGEKSKSKLPVLMYHYFYDKSKGETGKNANWMEVTKFEEQLKYLKDNKYYFPTWEEVEDFVDGKIDIPKKSVVITMDDGHKSLYKYAIPLLDKYKVRGTAFIITKKFNTKNLEKYKDSMIDFQSHTDNMHRAGGNIGHGGIFPVMSVKEGVKDLETSIKKLGGKKDALAYPYGDNNERTKEIVKKAGFRVAFTTVYGKVEPGMDKLILPRVRISAGISLNGFKNSL